jgi:hypothetical protein
MIDSCLRVRPTAERASAALSDATALARAASAPPALPE